MMFETPSGPGWPTVADRDRVGHVKNFGAAPTLEVTLHIMAVGRYGNCNGQWCTWMALQFLRANKNYRPSINI
jgi:hypothetical protein